MNDLSGLPKERQRLLNRSTGGEFTALAYLNIIQRGTLDEWVYLWKACNVDPETRLAVIDLLETGDPYLKDFVHMWADILGVPRPELGESAP
jgi:hypothetical protein